MRLSYLYCLCFSSLLLSQLSSCQNPPTATTAPQAVTSATTPDLWADVDPAYRDKLRVQLQVEKGSSFKSSLEYKHYDSALSQLKSAFQQDIFNREHVPILLDYALQKGDETVIKYLIETHQPSLNQQVTVSDILNHPLFSFEATPPKVSLPFPLVQAIQSRQSSKLLTYLLDKGARISTDMLQERTVLHMLSTQPESFKVLKSHGLTQQDLAQLSPRLYEAALQASNVEMLATLKQTGLTLSAEQATQQLALALAKFHQPDVIKYLFEQGAELELAFSQMESMYSVTPETLDLLFEHGLNKQSHFKNNYPVIPALLEKFLSHHQSLLLSSNTTYLDKISLLLSNTTDINRPVSQTGSSPLYYAIQTGSPEVVRLLIEKGASLDVFPATQFQSAISPLKWAVSCRHFEIARYLSQQGATFTWDLQDNLSWLNLTDIQLADLEWLKQQGIFDFYRHHHRSDPITKVLEDGDLDAFQFILDQNLDINTPDTNGQYPLATALRKGNNQSPTENPYLLGLLQHGGSWLGPAAVDTLLVSAELNSPGHFDLLKNLIQSGLAIDSHSPKGETALMKAVQAQQVDKVKWLLEHGANPNTVTSDFTLFGIEAKSKGTPLLYAAAKRNAQLFQLLLTSGANPHLPENRALLNWAVIGSNLEIFKQVLELGVELDFHDKTTPSPLWLAVAANHNEHEVVLMNLLQKGANINLQAFNGRTALMKAVNENKLRDVKLLLAKGANLDLQDHAGKTALDYAQEKNLSAMIQELKNWRSQAVKVKVGV